MSRFFKYDIVTLIELIENRPCLWDKTVENFNDKVEKLEAWRSVCAYLEPDFMQMDKAEQQKTGEIVKTKWQNLRDSFVKSLKKRSGQASSKKYLYHDNLQFLLKVLHKEDSDYHDTLHSSYSEFGEDDSLPEVKKEPCDSSSFGMKVCIPFLSRKRVKMQEELEKELVSFNKANLDEDEAFFISVLPSVRRLSEDSRLEFRMGVLQLLKDMNARDRQSAVSPHDSAY